MNIILPIVFFAAYLGLFVKRMTSTHWGILMFWIAVNIAYFYIKH